MRQSRASRQNKNFLAVTMVIGFILLLAVITLWTIAFNNEKAKNALKTRDKYTVMFDNSLAGDTICIAINDSLAYSGRVGINDTTVVNLKGNDAFNMLSIADAVTGKTVNENLPEDPSALIVGKDDEGNFFMRKDK